MKTCMHEAYSIFTKENRFQRKRNSKQIEKHCFLSCVTIIDGEDTQGKLYSN